MTYDEKFIQGNKEAFLKICGAIKRDGMNNLLDWLNKSDFFTAPASTKFHGNYAGGLCEHSLNVYNVAMKLKATYAPDLPDESIVIAALFHDICKANFYKTDYRNVKNDEGKWEKKEVYVVNDQLPLGHGEKSCIILQQFISVTTPELLAIRWHMSGYDSAVKGGDYSSAAAQDMTPLCSLLQAADILAAGVLEHSAE